MSAKFIKCISVLHGVNNASNFSIDVDKDGVPLSDICTIKEGVFDGVYAITFGLDNGNEIVLANPVNVVCELCSQDEYNTIQQRRKEYHANPPQPEPELLQLTYEDGGLV